MGIRKVGLLAIMGLLFPMIILSQDSTAGEKPFTGTVPEVLRRPQRGEAARYPRDLVIGDLGQGKAPGGAYAFARQLLSDLVTGNRGRLDARNGVLIERLLEELGEIDPRRYRLGGGREEADGSVSFLVRFLGREQGIAGELYLRPEDDRWLLDDLVLEEKRDLSEGKEIYPYDFTPYERFY